MSKNMEIYIYYIKVGMIHTSNTHLLYFNRFL